MTIAKRSLAEMLKQEKLSPEEMNALDQKLGDAIKSKFGDDPTFDPNSSINLSHFGLQGPDSLRRFLLTPAGETTTERLVTEKEREREIEAERLLQYQEEIRMEAQRRAFLHWLLTEEEAESQKAQYELIAMQQEKTLKDEQKAQQKAATPQSSKALEARIEDYNKQIDKLMDELEALDKRTDRLKQDRKLINNKYNAMQNSLADAPKFVQKTDKEIQAEIVKLQREADKIADSMMTPGLSDEEVYKKGDQLNAITAKIANLNDILASKKVDGKQFVDANGKPSSYEKAAFVIPKNQKIVKDPDGNYYLIKNGKDLKDLSDTEKNDAREAFKLEKKDIQVVKDVIKDTQQAALHSNTASMAQVKTDKLMVQNQINAMASARASLTKALTQQLAHDGLPMHPPKSSFTAGTQPSLISLPPTPSPTQSPKVTSTPVPTPQQVYQSAFVQTLGKAKQHGSQMTWGKLFTFVDKIENEDEKKEAEKFLNKELENIKMKDKPTTLEKIKAMLKSTPVPEVTMNAFLAHMEKFENAYKPSVTAEKSPLAQQQRQEPVSPSATNT
ncbi:coiled coil protein [Legionella steelei]|uniref:Coiled coil protein n=1 Tax=Legionella steelei TaxID=947033 RepID=A0A0W0ZJ72_9GAMM|nr:hypothetical protein [Legionella steelei]KTD68803.1 coiled coil protein [Legionella steelei]